MARPAPRGVRCTATPHATDKPGTRQDAGEGDALLRNRAVVVTGASTGIGLAAAALLLQRGFRVFGSVRRPADAERVQAQLGPGFTPLLFDVTDEAAVQAAAQQARSPGRGRARPRGDGSCTWRRAAGRRVPVAQPGVHAAWDLLLCALRARARVCDAVGALTRACRPSCQSRAGAGGAGWTHARRPRQQCGAGHPGPARPAAPG